MRLKYILPLLLLCVAIAGCATDDDAKETGITRSAAIGIAERHCPEYPDQFSYVDHAEWNPDGFWSVAITDRDGDHGKAFKIGRDGGIIATHRIDHDEGGYDDGPRHYGYGYGYWW